MKYECPNCGGKKRHNEGCTEKWTKRGPHVSKPYGVLQEFMQWAKAPIPDYILGTST